MSQHDDVVQLSRNPIKLLIWALIGAFVIWLAMNIATTVLIFSLAALIAYIVSSPIKWFSDHNLPWSKRKIPWAVATLIVYLLVAGVLTLLIVFLIPLLISQVNQLTASMPEYLNKLQLKLGELRDWYQNLHFSPAAHANLNKYGKSLLERSEPSIEAVARNVAAGILKLFSIIVIFLAALVFSLYIVLDEKNIKKNVYETFPSSWRKDTEELFHNVGKVVGVYVRGQVILCCIVGVVSYAVLVILDAFGLRYSYSLLTAIIIAVTYPIPFIGVWIPRMAAPVLAYLQTGEWSSALWIFLALSGAGAVVDNFILPVVMGRGIGISPLMVLFVIFAGGELFGIWGLILAIPAAAVIRLFFFYLQKHVTI